LKKKHSHIIYIAVNGGRMKKEKKRHEAQRPPEKDGAPGPEEQAAHWKDKALRALAEVENAKRIAAVDAKNALEYGMAKFALSMIPFSDSITLAINSMKGRAEPEAIAGLEAIRKQFEDALSQNGITRIKTVGEKLDPLLHMAVAQVASDKFDEGVVAEEMQPGYKLGDKVIREARVAVAKKN
jgi:molecular chaperone GrpE